MIKMNFVGMLVIMALMFGFKNANADDNYIGVTGGMTFNTDSEISNNDVSFNNGYQVGLKAGHVFNNIRVEGEIARQRTNNDNVNPWSDYTKLDTMIANVYYDYVISDGINGGIFDMPKISIYAMGGVGVGWIDMGQSSNNSTLVSNFGVGVNYSITNNIIADVGYKYVMASDTTINSQTISYNTNMITMGVKYMF